MASDSLKFSDKIFCVAVGKCPRCGMGNHYESNNPLKGGKFLNVPDRCPHCNLNFKPEIGFYWGASYVSYILTVGFSLILFLGSVLTFGFINSLSINFVIFNAVMLILFAPFMVRWSRTMWLWWFYVEGI